jgi:hypothetical protein
VRTTEKKFGVVKDRVEIYRDFALNLLYYIHHYYIDRETLSEDEDIYNHFKWCFKKVCDEFLEEGLDFTNNKQLYQYYYAYYYNQLYRATPNQDTSLKHFENFWKNIFEIDRQKNKNVINILIEIYNIYDKSINMEKNILEIV